MAQPLTVMAEQLPELVTITQTTGVRFTPNELRLLKADTGRGLNELMGEDADDADRMQTLAWLRLRREGRQVAWADLGDVLVEVRAEAAADPTSAGSSTSSPPSAASGG